VRKEVLYYQLSPMERISFRTVDISHWTQKPLWFVICNF
jgi:hypothetical protein